MRATGCLAVWGDFSDERLEIGNLAEEFNWPVYAVAGAEDLKLLSGQYSAVAVLLDPARLVLPWREALKLARNAAPRARIAICHRVGETHSRQAMTEAGAFTTLMLPLVHNEVRNFLGFVWASPPERSTEMAEHAQHRGSVGRCQVDTAIEPQLGVLAHSLRGF